MTFAPIVLFVYNRPLHTELTLNALFKNKYANSSTLYIFCDGPFPNASEEDLERINATRKIVKKQKWCNEVKIIESNVNKGLASSIIEGVTEVVNRHGKVIVLEDDIVTSPCFLKFMNDALNLYESSTSVFHISGYMYPHNLILPDTFFLKVPLCWGWATWKRAWDCSCWDVDELIQKVDSANLWHELNQFGGDYLGSQLKSNKSGTLNTWFVKWHTSVFMNNGYVLFPQKSLVQNIGFDNTGIHNEKTDRFTHRSLLSAIEITPMPIVVNENAKMATIEFYTNTNDQFAFRNAFKKNIKKSSFLIKPFIEFSVRVIDKIITRVYPGINKKLNWEFIDSTATGLIVGQNTIIYPPYHIDDAIIGSFTYISKNSNISKTRIGKFCSIGPNLICGWGIHPTHGISTSPMFYSTQKQNGISLSSEDKVDERKHIYIGNDVFIGMNVTILDGIKIGDGAIIGAGSLVSKNIPPYAIAAGNPIKILRYRFSEQIISELLKIKWWNFEKGRLAEVEQNIFDVNEFIKLHARP